MRDTTTTSFKRLNQQSFCFKSVAALLNCEKQLFELFACEKGDSNKEATHRNGATGAGLPKLSLGRNIEMVEGLGFDSKFDNKNCDRD